jgi:ABC-type sugar transport system ATPase subunit
LMVLRQGRLVGSQAVAETDTEKIVHMIVTGEVQD